MDTVKMAPRFGAIFFFVMLPVVAAAASAAPAADSAAPDLVMLRDGGFVRGVVAEVLPGSHVVIRGVTGQLHRFDIDQVTRVVQGGEELPLVQRVVAAAEDATPAAAVDAEAPPPAVPAAAAAVHAAGRGASAELMQIWAGLTGPRIKLALHSERPATLQRRIGKPLRDTDSGYHIVCQLPCVIELPTDDPELYRVGSGWLKPTEWFAVPPFDSSVDATLVPRSWDVVLGASVILTALTSAAGWTIFGLNQSGAVTGDGWKYAGITLASVSSALLVSTVALWLFGPKSTLVITPK